MKRIFGATLKKKSYVIFLVNSLLVNLGHLNFATVNFRNEISS